MNAPLWRTLPWLGCLLMVWLWHQQGVTQAEAAQRLSLTLSQQSETLTAQATSINRLQEEVARNNQLTLQVQSQAGQLLTEQGQAQKDIKETIIHEPCRTTELPRAAAVRLRQLATPPPLIKTEVVRLVPPASLIAPCPMPPLNLTTWGAVVEEDMPAMIAALRACDIRMTALRQWADSQKE